MVENHNNIENQDKMMIKAHGKPDNDSRLFAVLSHVTFGTMGILIFTGAIRSLKGNRFVLRHALTSIFNSIIAVLAIILWVFAYKVIGRITGFMIISDFYTYGIVGLILFFYITSFIASIGAAKGRESRIPWAYPIAKAIIK